MIEAVVFDVGGVITASPLSAFSGVDEEYTLPGGTVASFLRGGELWIGVETGRVSVAEFYRHCSERIADEHGVEVPVVRLDQMLEECMGTAMQLETVALVEELSEAGYKLGLCTNIFAERRDWLHSLFAEGIIDVYCDSSELGLRKPEPSIYRKLLELLDRPAQSVVFIDDFEENVAAARELGLATILYENAQQTRRALVRLGVQINAEERV
jgi:epoxide hydrolase-like predicted phosphatase